MFVKPNPHPTDASYVQCCRGLNIGILIAEKCHNPLVLDQLPNKVISQSPIRESQHGVTVSSSSLGRETSLVGGLGMAEKRQALGVKPQPGSLRCCGCLPSAKWEDLPTKQGLVCKPKFDIYLAQ